MRMVNFRFLSLNRKERAILDGVQRHLDVV